MDERAEFARRLNEALDESPLKVPPKGEGRQVFVSRIFGVDQKGARKWLEGEGFPKMERCIIIAKKIEVSVEWLLTGRGNKRMIDPADIQLAQLLNLYYQMPADLRADLCQYASFVVSKVKSGDPTATLHAPTLSLTSKKHH